MPARTVRLSLCERGYGDGHGWKSRDGPPISAGGPPRGPRHPWRSRPGVGGASSRWESALAVDDDAGDVGAELSNDLLDVLDHMPTKAGVFLSEKRRSRLTIVSCRGCVAGLRFCDAVNGVTLACDWLFALLDADDNKAGPLSTVGKPARSPLR